MFNMKSYLLSRRNAWRTIFVIASLFCAYLPTSAQNVTISPTSGKLIAALTGASAGGSTEVGFIDGYNSMWRHNQLPLTVTTADTPTLTENGQLSIHACNIAVKHDKLVNMSTGKCYLVFSLPKGFRFTSYKIVMENNCPTDVSSNTLTWENNFTYYETNSTFNTNSPIASQDLGRGSHDGEYTMSRTSTSKDDMGNLLYFVFRGNDAGSGHFGAIYYKHIEVTFAPDAEFTVPVAPTSVGANAQSYVESPFSTDKIDIGSVEKRSKTYAGQTGTFYSYIYTNVKDLQASNLLYEQDCVDAATGTVGSAAGTNSITTAQSGGKYYYGVKNHTYYVESPTTAIETGGVVLPLGYRIVGATVNYKYGTSTTSNGFYISYNDRNSTYYLGTDGRFDITDKNSAAVWHQDKDGYIYSGTNYLRYYANGGNYYLTTSANKSAGNVFTVSGNYITSQINETTYYINGSPINYGSYMLSNTNNAGTITAGPSTTTPASNYTLKLYDKTGNEVYQSADVSSTNASGSISLTGLNNDAVKFSIEGLADNAYALVTVDLSMEPLNPYIESMNVVCNGRNNTRLAQQFTTDDFSVGGDHFIFYVPDEYKNDYCTFTFEDLKSKYSDDTYGPLSGTSNSRYSFVESEFYKSFMTAGKEDIYGNKDKVSDTDYSKKVLVNVAGNNPFRFNNADELSNTSTVTTTNYLREYLFSVPDYLASTVNGVQSNFTDVQLKTGDTKTCYLFTADEPRYNIAPTFATQHLYYAYYLMTIELVTKTYVPQIAWTRIYDKTLSYDAATNTDVEYPTAGVRLETTEAGEGATYGYLTVQQIEDAMQASITRGDVGAPQRLKDVLYIDGSELHSIVYSAASTTGDVATPDGLVQLKNKLGDNALIYLPLSTTTKDNNFAYRLASGGFRSCNNIIITDKQPFYAPFDIQVDPANYASYTRQFTTDYNGQVQNATLILPFTLTIDANGKHTNTTDNCELTFYQLQPTDCLSSKGEEIGGHEGFDFQGEVHFQPVTTGLTTEANKPYHVVAANYTTGADSKTSFTASQYGSNIIASTLPTNYIITGETATGNISLAGTAKNYEFTNEGSYSGQKVAKGDNIFYFAKDHYYATQNLKGAYLYSYPFRSYYAYKESGAGVSGLSVLGVSFDENTTSIGNLPTQTTNLNVTTAQGVINIKAAADVTVTVNNISGQSIQRADIKSGESLNISVPSGIYIVNGVKVLVK
jgi:hypothetical protein